MTAADYMKARRLLVRRDPVIAGLIKRHGPCGLADRQHEDAFTALTHAIISQQLSTRAAATIARRFDALFDGRPTADAIARLTDDQLRAVGLSSQKIRYMRDLAAKVADGSVPLNRVNELADEDVIGSLTQVKGIGRWTAEMFLMFRLHRPDVLPVDDLGILKAVQRAYGLRKMPKPERLTKIGEPWRPYRSVACWYLWASLGNKPVA